MSLVKITLWSSSSTAKYGRGILFIFLLLLAPKSDRLKAGTHVKFVLWKVDASQLFPGNTAQPTTVQRAKDRIGPIRRLEPPVRHLIFALGLEPHFAVVIAP